MELLNKILKQKSTKELSKHLNVSPGTIKRWVQLRSVPPAYEFDLMKISGATIDYSNWSFKAKDQFFTPKKTAELCYKQFLEKMEELDVNLDNYTFIEPSAGAGAFLGCLPKGTIALDIEPRSDRILKADYLDWEPPQGKYIVFGNPPFGLRGHLALRFINHSAKFADFVAFILPQLFESDGKGVPRKRVVGFNLIHSEKLNTHFVDPNNKPVQVNCIFQIWAKNYTSSEFKLDVEQSSTLKIYSLSDGGTPSTTRNKEMFYKCHIYLPSTCFGAENMRWYPTFDELPRRKGYGIVFTEKIQKNLKKFKSIDWSKVAFLSTNSAFNIRTSQIASQFK